MNQANPPLKPSLPWRTALWMSTLAFFVDWTRRPNLTVNRFLFKLFDRKVPPSDIPINDVVTADIQVDPSRNLFFRVFTPVTRGGNDVGLPVIFHFHGGGFAYLGADSKVVDEFCRRISKELQVVTVTVNYRLAPEHRYPCQIEDGMDVLKFIDSANVEGFPSCANLKHCFILGDSAGGCLAHHVAVEAAKEKNFRELKVIGLILIQPLLGGEERAESEIRLSKATLMPMRRTDWMWKAFLPDGSNRDHPAANIFGPYAFDISGVNFPATAVIVGGFDTLQDWQKRYYEGLKKIGKEACLIEFPAAVHSFYAHPNLPESSLMIERLRDFISSQTKKH